MGNPLSAGLPNNSQQFVADIEIGQHIPTFGALNWFKSGDREYLRSGFLRAYAPKYAQFAGRVPAGCTNDLATRATGLQNLDASYPSCAMHFDGTRYVSIAFSPSGVGGGCNYSTDLSSWALATGMIGNAYASAQAGPGGTIVVVGADAAGSGCYKAAASTTFSPCVGIPTSALHNSVAFNTAGTLGIVTRHNMSQNTAGVHLTTTDAINYTSRTPTGGTNFGVGAVHYSPAAAAFLTLPTSSQSLAVNKTTDGISMAVSLATDGLKMPGDFSNRAQHYVASSPAATLVSCQGYKLKRTADGVAWTTVDLTQQNLPFVLSGGAGAAHVYYDPVTAKFYAWVGILSQVQSVAYLTSTDGITWSSTFNYRDSSGLGTPFVVTGANGKTLMSFATSATLQDWKDASVPMARSTPDWVGGSALIFGSVAGNVPYSHVRIA